MEAKLLTEIQSQILAMSAQLQESQITEPLLDAVKQKLWTDKWLKLRANHPQISRLEQQVYEFCAKYAKRPSGGSRLVIWGPNGVGKSHTAKAISRWAKRIAIELPSVCDDEGFRLAECEYVWWPEFCSRARGGEWDAIRDIWDRDLLIVDDVGAEHDPSKWAAEQFYMLLDYRETKWTVITTNVEPEHWATRFEKRIASRLLRNTTIVPLDTVPDYNG